MNKPLTVMIIDNETWYSENDWRILVAQKLELEARVKELEAENRRLRELLSGFYASKDIEDALRLKGDSDG